MSEKQAGG